MEEEDITKPEVSDDDVREKLRAVLPKVDLQTTTEKQLRKQLEEHFKCDLKARKPIFKEEIESFLLKNQDLFDEENEGGSEEEEQPKPKKKRKTGVGTRQSLSEQMQTFLGCDENADFSRPDVVKFIWNYIKKNDLQDPKNRRNIVADDKLKLIFTFPLDMFSMNKQLSKHLKSSGSTINSSEAAPKKRAKKKATSENGEKKKTGFAAPQKLSDALAELVGQPAASRGEVIKALWAYVKEHNLQNPDNKKVILVSKDEKLRGVLGVDKCEGFSMSKYLTPHFLGRVD